MSWQSYSRDKNYRVRIYMNGKGGTNISALGEWEDGDMERCGEKIRQGEHRFERKDHETPLGHTEFKVLMGHAGGDQKTTRPWRLQLLAKLLVQASAYMS